jgi:molybdopterin biosynthesis enzyme
VAIYADAGSHTVAELMAMARDAAVNQDYLIILGGHALSTHDLVAITSAGAGYVSVQLEPPPAAPGRAPT